MTHLLTYICTVFIPVYNQPTSFWLSILFYYVVLKQSCTLQSVVIGKRHHSQNEPEMDKRAQTDTMLCHQCCNGIALCNVNGICGAPRELCTTNNKQWLWFMVFNATFNNILVISRRSVLLVEKTRVPGENHRLAVSYWQTSSHNVVSRRLRHWKDSNSQR